MTLHAQTQPVFIDLRRGSNGRWELEVPPDEEEEKPARTRAKGENGEDLEEGAEENEEEEEEEEDEADARRNR